MTAFLGAARLLAVKLCRGFIRIFLKTAEITGLRICSKLLFRKISLPFPTDVFISLSKVYTSNGTNMHWYVDLTRCQLLACWSFGLGGLKIHRNKDIRGLCYRTPLCHHDQWVCSSMKPLSICDTGLMPKFHTFWFDCKVCIIQVLLFEQPLQWKYVLNITS